MPDEWEAQIVIEPGKTSNAVYLTRKISFGREYMKADDTIITVERNKPSDKDLVFVHLDDDQLRALMVALDRKGIKRPDAGYSEGKLAAVTEHLADMRHLVFKEDK